MGTEKQPAIPPALMESKAAWRRAQAALPIKEKFRILLQLQKQELPLIEKHRPLKPWEKPWPIEP